MTTLGVPQADADARADDCCSAYVCKICGYRSETGGRGETGAVRGNTDRFRTTLHNLWKCPRCLSIHNIDPVDFRDIYSDYPLNKRSLDVFSRGTLRNLLRRLEGAGIEKSASILDYGCGNGLFIQFLAERGYRNVSGYDPYVERFSKLSGSEQFDCVVANDVIEHVPAPRAMVAECARLVRPGGLLYLGTADSEPVHMENLEPHIMRLHQPFHRVIISEDTLKKLAAETGFSLVRAYRRSYMDTLRPFSNYRFLDEFNRALGHNLDLALDPAAAKVLIQRPSLFCYAFLGYFFPVAYEPAVILRKP